MSQIDLVGQTVDGKYRVEALLGRGGMGAVYRAVHLGTDRVVALKVIAPTLADQPEYLERFSREARACGRLRHPGIVDVTDFGIATHAGRPLAYLVMEFLDGATLADALRQQPRPPLPWVIDILEQVCSAVEAAHRLGILHRDLKPENVWLEPNRRGGYTVKVLDFGLAKLDAGDRADDPLELAPVGRLTSARSLRASALEPEVMTFAPATIAETFDSGDEAGSAMSSVAGTPAYMSPEQARGEVVTARGDVYSLGVMAYRMIAGRLPFEGSVEEVLTAQVHRDAPPLRAVRPDLHEDAAKLIAAALAKDPAHRPASAGVFGNMLAAQLEPASAFFRRALLLFIDRIGAFLRLGTLASAPLLVVSALLALWQLAHAATGVPAVTGTVAVGAMVLLFVLAFFAQLALGVMPIVVLHALAAPLRPLDPIELLRVHAPRIRRWLRAIAPFLISMLLWLALLGAFLLVADWIRPWVRQFSRPVRVLLLLGMLGGPIGLGVYALRRKRLGLRQTGYLGPVMLIEDLPFDAAARRSSELMLKSGGLRNAMQKWYLLIVGVVSMLFGAFLGAKGAASGTPEALLVMSPLLSVAIVLALTVNGLLGSLIYLSARRATGESMDRIFADFEATCR